MCYYMIKQKKGIYIMDEQTSNKFLEVSDLFEALNETIQNNERAIDKLMAWNAYLIFASVLAVLLAIFL